MTAPATNRKGQRLGAKGDRMRQALMEATAQLLAAQHPWAIKVADIAGACGVRPPNFYAYFDSIEEVILALAEQANAEQPDIAGLIDADWTEANALACARQLAALSVEHWEKHRPVLQVVNLLADAGDPAFHRARTAGLRPVARAFRRRIEAAQAAGALSAEVAPRLASYTLATQLERWGQHYTLTARSGLTHEQILDTLARLLLGMMIGLRLCPSTGGEKIYDS